MTAGPVGAAITFATAALTTAINAYTNTLKFQDLQNKNTMTEVRAAERLGLMRTDQNRGR